MYKIKSIKFNNHSILGNLELDFCDLSGKPVDTVIFAGENGNGKSTVLNLLYSAVSFNSTFPMDSMDKFYRTYENEGSYGTKTQKTEFLKMPFCDYICSMEKETLKKVFKNLGDVIDRINKDNIL